ncbi:hypothetical protein PV08_07732 [Exophiala spinifera]|uniref:Rhodanese domain-containing protein n=1 Tax=Exophiala spinifera TaxID=91928 RepID=A0A0D2B8F7_9EURO|nr:uncharacterized protein PV08_07732 [Exophiala spinifera]KIW14945.1 hypothetical protein PV08_07732 [Exophiala spinifera]
MTTPPTTTTTQTSTEKDAKEQPWHAFFPAPRTTHPKVVKREDVLAMLKSGTTDRPGRDFLLVDVRRNDHEGGTIRSSLNLPAQSLYHGIPTLYALATAASVPLVVFYCGSCNGRGPRAAGWFADYIDDQARTRTQDSTDGETAPQVQQVQMQSAILEGGIKGWVAGGEEYVKLVDGFEREVWEKTKTTK